MGLQMHAQAGSFLENKQTKKKKEVVLLLIPTKKRKGREKKSLEMFVLPGMPIKKATKTSKIVSIFCVTLMREDTRKHKVLDRILCLEVRIS